MRRPATLYQMSAQVWKKLRDMEAEAKRRNTERRQEPRHRSYDYDRGR